MPILLKQSLHEPKTGRAEVFIVQHVKTASRGFCPYEIKFQVHHLDCEKMTRALMRRQCKTLNVMRTKIDEERFEFSLKGSETDLLAGLDLLKNSHFMSAEFYDLLAAPLKLSIELSMIVSAEKRHPTIASCIRGLSSIEPTRPSVFKYLLSKKLGAGAASGGVTPVD